MNMLLNGDCDTGKDENGILILNKENECPSKSADKHKPDGLKQSNKANHTEVQSPVSGAEAPNHVSNYATGSDPVQVQSSDEKLIVLKDTNQLRCIRTMLRDKETCRNDFVFSADRLIRLVVEEGLNQLPYEKASVETPTNNIYHGLKFARGNCGVSIIRSGEAMEKGLRDCCRSIRIGKVLVQTDEETGDAKVLYAKFPADIKYRKILLMYPIVSSGNTVVQAVNVLREHGAHLSNIIFLSLFSSPQGIDLLQKSFPQMKILTAEINSTVPSHFGRKYFGTD